MEQDLNDEVEKKEALEIDHKRDKICGKKTSFPTVTRHRTEMIVEKKRISLKNCYSKIIDVELSQQSNPLNYHWKC